MRNIDTIVTYYCDLCECVMDKPTPHIVGLVNDKTAVEFSVRGSIMYDPRTYEDICQRCIIVAMEKYIYDKKIKPMIDALSE